MLTMTKLIPALLVSAIASALHAADAPGQTGPSIIVIGTRTDKTPEKLDHIMREVDGTKLTVTKKTSVTKLDLVPTIVDNNQRQLFARSPGLFVSEQQTATQFNASYRGLGNPQEAEYVLLLQDGLPISTDWIGFPTAYYMPLPQSLAEVQLIRGGSSLLYGPNPAPTVNLVSKRPAANEPLGGYSENVVGGDGLFSTYNTVQGSSGPLSARANLAYVKNNGQRDNGHSRVRQGDLYLAYRPATDTLWFVDFHDHQFELRRPRQTHVRPISGGPRPVADAIQS